MRDSITPLILTRDEEVNIGRTLGQLSWAAAVIVVDSFSTDRTVAIARQFPNVRVVERRFDTLANQSNFGIAEAASEWVMLLDADFFVPFELVRELVSLEPPPDIEAYQARFLYAVGGRPLRASLYPPRIVLFRRNSGTVIQDGHAHRVRVAGRVERLQNPIIHDDRKPMSRFIERQRIYMRQEAEKLRSTPWRDLTAAGRVRRLFVIAPFAALAYTLFAKRTILDGRAGLQYAFERFLAESILTAELGKRMAGRLVRLPLRLLPKGKVVRIRSGELRGWRWIVGAATHGCWAGTYERPIQELFRRLVRPGAVVFDVGANAGFYTLLASKLAGAGGRIFAFEPLPRNLEYLRRHLELNRVRNVTVEPVAVSATSGTARFRTAANASMGSLSGSGEIEVVSASLDDLLLAGRVPMPDLMKMDIEGGETDALRGASRILAAHSCTIILSAHGWRQHEQCSTILRDAGYDLDLLRDGTEDGDYLILATPSRSSDRP